MDTFERKETKYLLTPLQYLQFRALVEGHLVPAEYHESDVASLYYDTPDDTLVNRSIHGGTYKEKLRVRSYGAACASSPVFIEIKKKFKGITYKRRVNCTLAAAKAFLGGADYEEAIEHWPLADAQAQEAAHSAIAKQIAGEIAWMRDHYQGLAPKMLVTTHRLSYVGADDANLRVTFDADVRWDNVDASLEKHVGWHAMFPGGERILEVKCANAFPRWLVAALNECGARPQSVSKYGRAYQAAMRLSMHERVVPTARPLPVYTPAPQQAKAPRRRNLAAIVRNGLGKRMRQAGAAAQAMAPSQTRKPAHATQR